MKENQKNLLGNQLDLFSPIDKDNFYEKNTNGNNSDDKIQIEPNIFTDTKSAKIISFSTMTDRKDIYDSILKRTMS